MFSDFVNLRITRLECGALASHRAYSIHPSWLCQSLLNSQLVAAGPAANAVTSRNIFITRIHLTNRSFTIAVLLPHKINFGRIVFNRVYEVFKVYFHGDHLIKKPGSII
jgi:hypothetical protein